MRRELKYKREMIGLTQKEFARKINVSREHYGRIERGQCNPTLELARKICIELKVNLEVFSQ